MVSMVIQGMAMMYMQFREVDVMMKDCGSFAPWGSRSTVAFREKLTPNPDF
jgi:hypothetical protein